MYIKGTEYKPKDIYKFIRQASNKTHQEIAQDLKKSVDWSKSNESGRNNFKFIDLQEICKLNNIEILFIEKEKENENKK